jgi:BlaI family penicillinase repressor
VSEADCVFAASESFLDQVFGGSLTPLVAYFVERRKLTRKQINELKELLDQEGRP